MLCRELGIFTGTFYNWRSKYAGREVNEAKRLMELDTENKQISSTGLLAERLHENRGKIYNYGLKKEKNYTRVYNLWNYQYNSINFAQWTLCQTSFLTVGDWRC